MPGVATLVILIILGFALLYWPHLPESSMDETVFYSGIAELLLGSGEKRSTVRDRSHRADGQGRRSRF